jgi:hypothetical protein
MADMNGTLAMYLAGDHGEPCVQPSFEVGDSPSGDVNEPMDRAAAVVLNRPNEGRRTRGPCAVSTKPRPEVVVAQPLELAAHKFGRTARVGEGEGHELVEWPTQSTGKVSRVEQVRPGACD